MINPIYRWFTGGLQMYPVYSDDVSISYEQQSGEQFYRRKFNGDLTFVGEDYSIMKTAYIGSDYKFVCEISYDNGASWAEYWKGHAQYTACEWNDIDRWVKVTPESYDQYTDILNGIEKEFDLIDLLPPLYSVKYDKRPMIQMYVPGDTAVGCFLGGMYWEQECTPVSSEDELLNKYNFALNKRQRVVGVTTSNVDPLLKVPSSFVGDPFDVHSEGVRQFTNGDYIFEYYYGPSGSMGSLYTIWRIRRRSDNVALWEWQNMGNPYDVPYQIGLPFVPGTGATGTVYLDIMDVAVYGRYVTDKERISSTLYANPLPADDLVPNNRNYHYAVGYSFPDLVFFSQYTSATPTEWGLAPNGQYYSPPTAFTLGLGRFYPVARSSWGAASVWFASSDINAQLEEQGRTQRTLKDAYAIFDVISLLLKQIAPGITHGQSTRYSQFLYGDNPITLIREYLFITPKSNIVNADYDQPARKAPITLRQVFDMLRDCFRCFWWIDENNYLRIEHISYFMNGGSYYDKPQEGINLNARTVSRSGKAWSDAQGAYHYDLDNMPVRYQFGWMDNCTQMFEGYPIDIRSEYVRQDLIEDVKLQNFTSDIDYILLNPSDISKDGYVLILANIVNEEYLVPYLTIEVDKTEYVLQNGWASFLFLQRYYLYDLPGKYYAINGVEDTARGIKRNKVQEVTFPAYRDVDIMKLVRTRVDVGQIEKISINLSSRGATATLRYDTEQL